MIPRDIPGPRPTANDRTHRLDAEAEAWMNEHAPGIINAWLDHRDPTKYARWDEAAARQHWPELWTRWRTKVQADDRLAALIDNEYERRRPRPPLA